MLRRILLALAGLAALAAVPQVRQRLAALLPGGTPELEELTKDELYERAKQADIPGRSEMTKDQLADALRAQGL